MYLGLGFLAWGLVFWRSGFRVSGFFRDVVGMY